MTKIILNGYKLHDSVTVTFLKRSKYKAGEQMRGIRSQGLGEEPEGGRCSAEGNTRNPRAH